MIKDIKYTWEDIYENWNYISLHNPVIKQKLLVNRVEINQWRQEREYFYGLDWIANEHFAERTQYISDHTIEFMLSGECLNKGTLATLEYLVNAEDEETRAAIWIYAFIRDVKRVSYGKLAGTKLCDN